MEPDVQRNSIPQVGGRAVLDGAFELLEALSRAPDGAGLSELACESGLPKTTVHRLLEQLVALGAVQKERQRYHVGSTLARLGRAWQPHPALRRASLAPSRTLARLTGGAVVVCVLAGNMMRVVTAAGTTPESTHRMRIDDERAVRTATGQVLLAFQRDRDLPPGYSHPEWKRVRDSLSRHAAVAVDRQDILPGVYCAAAAIPLSPSGEIASIATLFVNQTPPRDMSELILRAARETARSLGHR